MATKADLDAAVEAWLNAQAGFQQYVEATEELFRIYSEGWCGPRRALAGSFDNFRAALLRDAGYSLKEVNEAYPEQRPECG